MTKKICIVGGGASGLYCAMQLKLLNPSLDVTVVEKNPRVGKKLLATGNGKCNFTNSNQTPDAYKSEAPDKVNRILKAHTAEDICTAFKHIGIESTNKGELIYPKSMQASAVLDALRFKLAHLGVTIETDFEVKSIRTEGTCFKIIGTTQKSADAVVIACGSNASGGSASGIKLLRSFGHMTAPLYPALVPVVCDTTNTKIAKGMRAQCKVTLYKNNKIVASETGEVLFTDYGISGICIMQLSGYISKSIALNEKATFHFEIDFMPELNTDTLLEHLKERRNTIGYMQTGEFLSGFLNKKISQSVIKASAGIELNAPACSLTDEQLIGLTSTLKRFTLKINGVLDAAHAQVCGGGALLDDFTDSLESKKQKNLYACGEVLDVVGDCGGYNLTWAWASACAVAKSMKC